MKNSFQAYPFYFDPIYKPKIWGGQAFNNVLKKNAPIGTALGESWEISALAPDLSVVSNGPLSGRSLAGLCRDYPEEILGSASSAKAEFPLLYKFIDAQEKLSVQVHPDDEWAGTKGPSMRGKAEAWYIAAAKPGAKIIAGFKPGILPVDVRAAIEKNSLASTLNYMDIAEGDVLFIPPGTVHAILEGTLVYEVQASSDITYRFYDWDRRDKDGNTRQLHVSEALAVMKTSLPAHVKTEPVVLNKSSAYSRSIRMECTHFRLEEHVFDKPGETDLPDVNSFCVITVLKGEAVLKYPGGTQTVSRGRTTLVPASLKKVSVIANKELCFLLSYVPKENQG
jgi:mannose-6-phosphate isomerase